MIKPGNGAFTTIAESAPAKHLDRPHALEHVAVAGAIQEPEPPRSRAVLWLWMLILSGAVAAGWYYRATWLPWVTSRHTPAPGTGGKSGGRVVPVRTAVVEQRDMPLYIKALGTVTAFKTVTLRSRVDGELVRVAFTEGQMVKEGDLLAEIDPRPFEAQLKQAEGTLAKDTATLKLAQLTLERGEDLSRTKAIAAQQLDEEAAQVATMEGTVQTDQALVDNARLQLSYCKIVAPLSGRIGLRLVDPGNIVHASDLMGMAVITQLQPIALVFPISQDDIPNVQRQTNAGKTLSVDAYSRDSQTRLASGTLAAIDNIVDPTTGTVKLKAIFDNEDNMLFPNQFVNARLQYDTKQNAIVVPAAAVQNGPRGTFVYVVQPDDTVAFRTVIKGTTEAADAAIDSGLSPGEIVVTDGLDKLFDGAKVTTLEREKEREAAKARESQEPQSPADSREATKKDSR